MPLAATPLLQPSAGRSRVETAAELIQQGLRQLWAEQREREKRQREFKVEYDERTKAAIAKAQLRVLKQQHMLSVDRRWFWNFTNEMLELLRQVAADARRRGEAADANIIERVINDACEQLERIQRKDAAR
jgi:hypothetical protein